MENGEACPIVQAHVRARPSRRRADEQLRVAGIDIGSNGIRLLVADAVDGGFREVARERAAVRLGHQAFTKGILDPGTVAKAVEALTGFRDRLVDLGVRRLRTVATSAVRDSEDVKDFVRTVRRKAGLRVEVITGREEARLVHRAVRDRIPWSDKPWIVMDLGGGSLEVALVDRHVIQWSESRRIGTVRLLEKHGAGSEDAAYTGRVQAEVDQFQLLHSPARLDIGGLVATGGNINDLTQLIAGSPDDGPVVCPLSDLTDIRERLAGMSLEERIHVHKLRPDRADVIVAAAMIYERVALLAGVDHILVPGWGLREGLVLSLIDEHEQPRLLQDPLDRSVEDDAIALGRAFRFDEDHAHHVASLSLQLFDRLQDMHGLKNGDRRLLHAAALLHDIGRSISDNGHHKHSQYLIEHAELSGLSEREVQMAATVARYHRKALPQGHHHLYRMFGQGKRRRVDRLSAILRLADGFDHERIQNVTTLAPNIGDDQVRIGVGGRGDLRRALENAGRKADLFERAFNRPVVLEAAE